MKITDAKQSYPHKCSQRYG